MPPPNADAWHNTDVAISFECVGTVTCPGPVVLANDGANQRLVRSVIDKHGRTASLDLVVNIDKSPGSVRIDLTRPSQSDRVTVTARADDALSGVAAAYCDGVPAQLHRGAISCEVPIRDGFTDIVVTALDRAGNSACDSSQLRREASSRDLQVFPFVATMRVGDKEPLYLADSAWQELERVWWRVEDPAIANVDAAGNVTALSEGQTTVTGTADDGRTATMTLTVIAAGAWPLGTKLWTAHELRGTLKSMLLPPPPDGASLRAAEVDGAGNLSISAVSLKAKPLWFTRAAVASRETVRVTMSDHSGSPLLWVGDSRRSAITRSGRVAEGRLWRYELPSAATDNWALGWDGTLWVVETPSHGYSHVNAIDYLTGELKFRVGMPWSLSPATTGVNQDSRVVARPGEMGSSGAAFIPDGLSLAVPYVATEIGHPRSGGNTGPLLASRQIRVLRVSPDAETHIEDFLGFTSDSLATLPAVRVIGVRPGGQGSLLVLMQLTYADGRSQGWAMRRSGDSVSEYPLPVVGEWVLGHEHAYTTDGITLVAFDPASGKVAWTRTPGEPLKIAFAAEGGGVLVYTPSGRIRFAADGTSTQLK